MNELSRREIVRKRLRFQLDCAILTGFAKCLGPHPEDGSKPCCPHGLRIPCWKLYRCVYCGFFFCESCAEIHFGKTRAAYEAEQESRTPVPFEVSV